MASIQAILEYKAKGLSQSAIAKRLGTTVGTVAGKLWRHKNSAARDANVTETYASVTKPIIQFVPAPEKVHKLEDWQNWGDEQATPQVGEFRDALVKLERDKRHVVVEHDHDNHFPYHDPDAQALRSKVRQVVQPDLIVVGSDAADFPTISRFEEDRRIANIPPLSHFRGFWWPHVAQLAYDAPNALRVWIDGNHDARAWLHIEAQKDHDSLKTIHAKTIQANNHVYWLGSGEDALEILIGNALIVTHGTRANIHTAAATLDAYDRQYSVLAGHSHRPDYFTRSTKYKVSASIGGCGCLLKPHYDRRNTHSHWQHSYQYAVVDTVTETAIVNLVEFYHTQETIWCYVNGQVITVKKQALEAESAA